MPPGARAVARRTLCGSSYSVAERTQELGLRFALGATPGSLLGLVLSDGLKLVGIGVGLGLAVAFVLARFLETQLFGVTAHDPVTFIVVPSCCSSPPSSAA